jgi:hypothetical protein
MLSQASKKMNLHRFITAVCHALPKGVVSVEDIIIKGNQIILRYTTEQVQNEQKLSLITNSQVITVNSIDAVRLFDGKLMEHQDTIYQVKIV